MNEQLQKLKAEYNAQLNRANEIVKLEQTPELDAEYEAIMSEETDSLGTVPSLLAQISSLEKKQANLNKHTKIAGAPPVDGIISSSEPSTAVIPQNTPVFGSQKEGFESDPMLGFATKLDFLEAAVVDGRGQQFGYTDHRPDGKRDPRMAFLASGCSECTSTKSLENSVPVPRAISDQIFSNEVIENRDCWQPTNMPMQAKEIDFPSICDRNGGIDSYAGVMAYWVGEEHCFDKYQEVGFDTFTLKAFDLMAGACIKLNMIRDSPRTVAAILETAIPRAIAKKKQHAYLRGTGIGQFLGVYNAPAFLTTQGREVAGEVSYMDVINLSTVHADLEGAAIFIHPTTLPCFLDMWRDGKSCCNIIFEPGSNGGCSRGVFQPLNLPIIVTQLAPCKGQCNDVSIINMNYYVTGTDEALNTRMSDEFMFNCRTRVWQWHQRIAGTPMQTDLLTPDNPCPEIGYAFTSALGVGLGGESCETLPTLPRPGKKTLVPELPPNVQALQEARNQQVAAAQKAENKPDGDGETKASEKAADGENKATDKPKSSTRKPKGK